MGALQSIHDQIGGIRRPGIDIARSFPVAIAQGHPHVDDTQKRRIPYHINRPRAIRPLSRAILLPRRCIWVHISNPGNPSTIFPVSRLTVITRSNSSRGYLGLFMVSIAQSLASFTMPLALSILTH